MSVKDGVVTLSGFVRHYRDEYEPELAAARIAGVVEVANDIEVRLPDIDEGPDLDLAREVLAAIRYPLPNWPTT